MLFTNDILKRVDKTRQVREMELKEKLAMDGRVGLKKYRRESRFTLDCYTRRTRRYTRRSYVRYFEDSTIDTCETVVLEAARASIM